MSEAANANNCINCNLSRRKFIGKVKRIITEDEVIKYQAHCSNTVTIGSVFCNKCRLNVCRAQRPERVIDENDCVDNTAMDPDFHVQTRNMISEANVIELPLKIYYSSHGHYKSKIIKPVEILTELFDTTNVTAVIDEDSDEV